ncbi:MAG: ribosome biogenesis GTPase YlqF [Ruminococcaceae bacterium]|nr:ribosome biogenesis GTPase YlqF [Oscillospiraceae bacterium]
MQKNPIQWFPGHMAKTRRVIKECLSQVDIVLELLDARIPYSSKNPETESLIGGKPKLTVLTKATLANLDLCSKWKDYYEDKGQKTVIIDSAYGIGIDNLSAAVREILSEKIEKYKAKGMEGRALKAMIVGIPNVGKSSLINRLAGAKKAKVENRPGVTLSKQWVPTEIGIDLLDMPGVLWPKFEDETVGENLAITGAIRDAILDSEEIAMVLCARLMECARNEFMSRYKLTDGEVCDLDSYDLFRLVGKKRGFLMAGGEINHLRTAEMLLEEFRSGKIGRITLESPN